MRKWLLLLSIVGLYSLQGQNNTLDSLRRHLQSKQPDTSLAKDYNEMAWQYLDLDTDSSEAYVHKAMELSKRIAFLSGEIDAKNTLGILYRFEGETDKAVAIYEEVIAARLQQGRTDKLTGAYSNMGSAYFEAGRNAEAIKCYQKAFEIARQLHQYENQTMLYNNLGNAYSSAGLKEQAIDAFKSGLELNKRNGDDLQQAMLYSNLATVYDGQNLNQEALKYSLFAYDLFVKENNLRQKAYTLNNITLYSRRIGDYKATEKYLEQMRKIADELEEGSYYSMYHQSRAHYLHDVGKLREALQEAEKAVALGDTVNYREMHGNSLLIKASILADLDEYENSLRTYDDGIAVLRGVDDIRKIAGAYEGKSTVYNRMKDYKSALQYFQRAYTIYDSLDGDSYNSKIATLNSLNELDRKEKELQLSIKEKENVEAKSRQQKQFLIAAITISLLVLVLLVFSIRAYRVKKKDNELLNTQKREIQHKNEELHVQNVVIEKQKMLVEEKQKEILDSIHYARRIQRAMLAHQELIDKHFPGNFILFKPKDIVSGDFYWATEKGNRFYLAVCDSTGHGVPGAFMSLLNISFLNEAITEKNIEEPHRVLNHVRQRLIANLSQDGAKDGMDGVLICYDRESKKLSYAAAHNRPLLFTRGQVQECRADKMPVGMGEKKEDFSLYEPEYSPGDVLYLYSDGFADQFGGSNGKKFKFKSLLAEIQNSSNMPLHEQGRHLEKVFENWRGQLEQVDDVLLVGLKL